MKTLFFDCGMGAAGDMLTAALLELMPDREAAVAELNALGIPGIVYEAETAEKCGIQGTHMSVKINGEEEAPGEGDHEHHHHHHHHDDEEGHEHHHHHDGEEGHEHHHHHDHEAEEHAHHHDELHEHTHTLPDGTVITHTHEHEHEHTHTLPDGTVITHTHEHEHEHTHEHSHEHEHEHTHEHSHEHPHDHDHGHTHEHGHSHHHAGMHDIEEIVAKLPVSEKVRADVMAVYGLIGEAESHAHGVPVTEIHFHEVGTMDAIADVTAVCWLMEKLAPEQVLASPVHVGAGTVRCAHGVLPVPAPATAYILRDVPIYGGRIESELCTPTGAALLRHFVSSFGDMPVMKISGIGYGCGKKDFFRANVVRAMLGETAEAPKNTVCELNFNVDDMTAEEIGYASERFFEAGAMDVFTIPIGMKKSRPGTLVSIICRPEDRDEIVKQVFLHTSTIGMREKICERYVLNREIDTVETEFGPVRVKRSTGYGVTREKYEYDDLARIAKETGLSLNEIKDKL